MSDDDYVVMRGGDIYRLGFMRGAVTAMLWCFTAVVIWIVIT